MEQNQQTARNDRKGCVLVVDDEPAVRKPICLSLIKAGYTVVAAENGAQAIKTLNSSDAPLMVDTILCDLMMPLCDGAHAISYFRFLCPAVPVVLLTGAPDFVITDVLLNQGVTDYLLKPVSERKLLQTIRMTVALHALRRRDHPRSC